MTLSIALDPELEKQLTLLAAEQGVAPNELARRLIERHLEQRKDRTPDTASLAVIEKWEAENATTDPVEIARREKEGEEFMRSLARSRVEMEGPNARKLWP